MITALLIHSFDHQRVSHQFPQILHLHIHHVILFAQTLHDLVTTVVAGSDKHLSSGIFDLFGLHPAVVDALLSVGHGPGATTGSAAVVVDPVGVSVHKVVHALLGNPAGFLVVAVAES